MNGPIVYYPIFPPDDDPVAERTRDVRDWVERFMLPAGLATEDEEKANAYLVAGGDGWLMRTVREKFRRKKIIFGINRGTLGFLLNPVEDIRQIPTDLSELNLITVRLIAGEFFPRSGALPKKYLAFNDVFCGGNVADYITFDIRGEFTHFPRRVVRGNGVIISTPQGTTGFPLKTRGSAALLPLRANHWFISGVATGPYPADQVSPQRIEIGVTARTPVSGYADGYSQEVKDVAKVVVTPTAHRVTLGFVRYIDFAWRRTELAQKVERGEA